MPARLTADRLMRLDAVLTGTDLDWLTTKSEKVAYLEARAGREAAEHPPNAEVEPSSKFQSQLPGTFPIGIDPTGRVVLLYLATVPWTDDFRTFLIGHTALLSVTSAWTLRLVFPQSLQRVVGAYETAVHEELASPLDGDTIGHLTRYFFHRRRGDVHALSGALRAHYAECEQRFSGPRFTRLYRRWLIENIAALTPAWPTIGEALAAGRARVESVVLPHTYEHLSPVVSRRRSRRRHARQWEERGEQTPRSINPFLNPVP